jgi:hypothetical protein
MGLESGSFIGDLVETNPAGGDARSAGDDHLRLIKAVLKGTFPGFNGVFNRTIEKAVDFTPANTENCVIFICTAALTINLPAVSVAGNGFNFGIWAIGGTVTLDGFGAELVNGAATRTVSSGSFDWCYTDGTAWALERADRTFTRPTLDTPTVLGTLTVPDDMLLIDAAAPTKKARIDVGAVTAGQTRVMTMPDQDFTPAGQGKQTIWIPAGAFTPRITNGPAYGLKALGDMIYRSLAFSPTTGQSAQFLAVMPKSWNAGAITGRVRFASTGTGAVVWGLRARYFNTGDAQTNTFPTGATVTTAYPTANLTKDTAEIAFTPAGTATKGCTMILEVYRDAAAGADTMDAALADLLGVEVFYSTNGLNDA